MTETKVTTKSELLSAIDRDWLALQSALARMDEAQMAGVQDGEGWTVKDHLVHIAAWERSTVYFLQGKARHTGLGVDEATYLAGDDDVINAAVYRQTAGTRLPQAVEELQSVHRELLALLQGMSDEDLQQPYRHYLPDEPGAGDGPAINLVYNSSANHYREHLAGMAGLLAKGLPM